MTVPTSVTLTAPSSGHRAQLGADPVARATDTEGVEHHHQGLFVQPAVDPDGQLLQNAEPRILGQFVQIAHDFTPIRCDPRSCTPSEATAASSDSAVLSLPFISESPSRSAVTSSLFGRCFNPLRSSARRAAHGRPFSRCPGSARPRSCSRCRAPATRQLQHHDQRHCRSLLPLRSYRPWQRTHRTAEGIAARRAASISFRSRCNRRCPGRPGRRECRRCAARASGRRAAARIWMARSSDRHRRPQAKAAPSSRLAQLAPIDAELDEQLDRHRHRDHQPSRSSAPRRASGSSWSNSFHGLNAVMTSEPTSEISRIAANSTWQAHHSISAAPACDRPAGRSSPRHRRPPTGTRARRRDPRR